MLTQNKIFLTEEVAGKGHFFKARFLQPGLVKYSFGVCLLTKEVIDSFVQGFVGCSVTIGHVEIDGENCDDVCCGVISRVEYNEADGWYWCEGILRDPDAIELVRNGYTVSCQYRITEYADNTTGALHNGMEYDKTILGGNCEQLAIVKTPRYGGAMIAVNALDKTNDGKFVTLKRKDGSLYKAHLAFETNVVDSFCSYEAHLTAAKLHKDSLMSLDKIDKTLKEIAQDIQDEIDTEEELNVVTSGVRAFIRSVANDEDIRVESIGKYHFTVRRDHKEMSKFKAERVRDSLNKSELMKNLHLEAKIEPAGDMDTGAGWAIDIKRKEDKVAKNSEDKDGRWITIKGAHVFIKDGQSTEDAMKESFGEYEGSREKESGKSLRSDSDVKAKIGRAMGHYRTNADDIARETGLPLREVHKRLKELVDEGEVEYSAETDTYMRLQKTAKNSIKEQFKDCLYNMATEVILDRLKENNYLEM